MIQRLRSSSAFGGGVCSGGLSVACRIPRGDERRRATYARGNCRPESAFVIGIVPRTAREDGGERRRGGVSTATGAALASTSACRGLRVAGTSSDGASGAAHG